MTSVGRRLRRFVCALSLMSALGCSQARRPADEPWVAEVARRHALADQRLEAGDRTGAGQALRAIVDTAELPTPSAELPADARRGVLQDTYFRLARIELEGHEPRAALADAERGLALGGASDLFVANLLVVRGAAREALGEAPAAAADYHRALVINDHLLSETLHASIDGGPR